ncbi:cytosolic phospholipase A2 gamma-like [Thomomys bottae]
MSSFYSSHGDIAQVEMDLKQRFEQQEWNWPDSLQKAVKSSRFTNYSLTDFWAYLVVSRQSREFQDSCLSSLQEDVEAGKLPYPIFAAIDNDLQDEWVKEKTKYSWFEFTPHHAGYPALGAYIPITQFGSKFQNGKLSTPECERDLSFLRGLWGSAVANSNENKKFIWDEISKLKGLKRKDDVNTRRALYSSPGMDREEPDLESLLLDMLMAYIEDPKAPGLEEKLQALKQALEADTEVYGPVCRELEETIPKWKAMSEEEQSQFLWFLADSLTLQTQPEETLQMQPEETVEYSLMSVGSSMLESPRYFLLGSKNDKTVEKMCRRNVIHLVDAGLAINSAYPLVLPPARDVQLILSFDFSAGDPFEELCHCGGSTSVPMVV